MDKIFSLTSTFKSLVSDDGSVIIRGMASTSDFDRAGDSISAEAWQKGGLNNFEKKIYIIDSKEIKGRNQTKNLGLIDINLPAVNTAIGGHCGALILNFNVIQMNKWGKYGKNAQEI